MKEKKDERKKSLEIAIEQITKRFGKGAIMRLGDEKFRGKVEVIPTGAISLDIALGVGGIPRGRIIEVYGPEGGGKTTLSLQLIANVQKNGGIAAFIDAEHALDPIYAKKLGVDVDKLLISQPDNGEQALEIAETLVRSGAVDIIVIDSVAALVPKAEVEGSMGDSQIGLQARLMSQALRKLTSSISKSRTAVIFINQVREKIHTFGFGGVPETTPGGRALKFYSSVRLEVKRIGSIKKGDKVIGIRVSVKVSKNKVAPPFRSAEFDMYFEEGISREASLIDTGVLYDVVKRQGTWFTFGNVKLGQGKEAARNFLKANPDIADKIEEEIKKKAFSS
ncbi:MAG: recombinase RecA [Caldiserica bacterium]|nr:MAG: recombinase RecA [Caldisericota bacterium]